MIDNKIVVLIEESPKDATFNLVAETLGLKGVDPLDFIEPESHMLSVIYRDVFTNETANGLLAYLINKRGSPLVFDIFDAIASSNEKLILVNTTLLTEEDVRFLSETITTMKVVLKRSPQEDADFIYKASKKLRDKLGV